MGPSRSTTFGPLRSGAHIAIIGGGPAGCFFALHALRFMREKHLDIQLTIFDAKNFLLTGPPGCNLCAGVISEKLIQLLKTHNILLDSPKVQRRIRGYFLQTPLLGAKLPHPNWNATIYSVFRGNGPRFSSPQDNISFDDLLLQHVIREGVLHKEEPVKEIILPSGQEQLAQIVTQNHHTYSVDLVVGAFGLNSPLLRKICQLDPRYRPPKSIATFQAELALPDDWIRSRFQDHIVVFSYRSKRTRYAVVVPKKGYLSISIINRGDAEIRDLLRLFQADYFKNFLPEGTRLPPYLCHCRPRIALSSARSPFADRLVLIGDASYTRIYKNGIESAYYSALYAARTAFHHGISRRHFRRFYHIPMKKLFIWDNFFGRLMFTIYDFIIRYEFLSRSFLYSISQGTKSRMNRHLRNIVWNMFTGQERYARIILQFINPLFQLYMIRNTLESLWQKFPFGETREQKIRVLRSREGLVDGATVGIVGGGPGGIAAAITLQSLARERGIRLHTIIYEGKTYSGVPHYNQCVGVLSPPIHEIMEGELQIPFPNHLVQREINGYVLHSDHNRIHLEDRKHPSYAVRRITFDEYLMEQVIQRGVEIRHSRVTDIEIHPDRAVLYSETDSQYVDAIIGAFGLDDGSIQMFERVTDYRAPEFLYSIVTKIHPGPEYMSRIGESIFAFLPSFHQIEFGAITPKQNHITINIAGKNVDTHLMDLFLQYPPVRKILPQDGLYDRRSLYYFKGKFPISIARHFYGHRYVMVGDAAGLVRPFKGKGINSAMQSGVNAARVMMHEGVSTLALKRYEEACDEIVHDLPYGHFMRRFAILSANYGLLDFFIHFGKENHQMYQALFDSVSAHKFYREIFHNVLEWPVPKNGLLAFGKFITRNFHF